MSSVKLCRLLCRSLCGVVALCLVPAVGQSQPPSSQVGAAASAASGAPVDKTRPPIQLGDALPEFELPGTDGRQYTPQDFEQSPVLVLIFTCNHCPTAQAYEQRIIELHRDYRDRGVAVVAVSPNADAAVRLDELGYTEFNDSLEEMKLRAGHRGFEFPYLYDGQSQTFSRAVGVLATPHVFIFDAQRRLRYRGRIDDSDIKTPTSHDARRAIDQLLAGEPVAVPETRVFGCSTKWADKIPQAEAARAKWDAEEVQLAVIEPEQLHRELTAPGEKYRLVNVWATWCIPCVEELEELVTIHRMYRKRHFELITVSADDPQSQAKALEVLQSKFCSARNYMLKVQNQDQLFDAVDAKWQGAVPYTLLIAPDGQVVHRVHGEFDPLELKRVIVEHLGRTYASRKSP